MLVQLQEGLQHVPAVVKAPLCFKKISSTDFFTIVPSGTNLEKPLGTFRKLLALPEAGRLSLVRGAGMGDVWVQGKEHSCLWGRRTQHNRNFWLVLNIFIALRKGKRWSSKVIENTHG